MGCLVIGKFYFIGDIYDQPPESESEWNVELLNIHREDIGIIRGKDITKYFYSKEEERKLKLEKINGI